MTTSGRRERRAYIGSFTRAGGPGITVAHVDGETGALTPVHSTAVAADPSFLALSDDGNTLYAVGETEPGTATAFSLADPDRPEPLGPAVPVEGDAPTHLALAGSWLFTANYRSGSVSALPVAGDGGLGKSPVVLRHQGGGPVSARQAGPHAHAVAPDPTGRWLLAADLGTDSVYVSALDPETGEPTPHGETRLRPGSGPRMIVFHPDGQRAYVLNELDATVTVCRWDAGPGVLEPLETATVVTAGAVDPTYPSTPVLSPDGRFLWAANRGDDTLATLALDPSGDAPRLRSTVSCGGHWPRHLAAHPDGGLLYAANERSGDVTWFTVDPDTGIPVRAGSVAAPAASCVVFR
ncbi:lactonase family protein [Streptomyces mobaraensis]|uniref:Lactonase family protein n=1 Tax=Streptomyces mobaraensis TaxID=35621 RepID=A0A5N5W9Q0_STRMB|nr:lactonase family protein [Streptomyces mobaraensis]KAB7845578.1 lactonase family protein [Streptomyces mobaraensis]